MRVFLDQERLEAGERWDQGFVQTGIATSTVILPLVSAGALSGMVKLSQVDKIDWLLLEWEVAIALYEAGRLGKIFPILLGKVDASGLRTNFFQDGSDCGADVPDQPSQLTSDETAKFLQQIDPSITPERRSVRGTRDALLRYQAHNLETQSGTHGGGSDRPQRQMMHDEEAVLATVTAVQKVVEAAVHESVTKAAAIEPSTPGIKDGGTPRSRTLAGMSMPETITAIKEALELEDGIVKPRQVIAAAAEQLALQVTPGTVMEELTLVAAELGIKTGW